MENVLLDCEEFWEYYGVQNDTARSLVRVRGVGYTFFCLNTTQNKPSEDKSDNRVNHSVVHLSAIH